MLTHSDSATVREAVLHTPPARVFCTASAPFEEGRRLADDLRTEGLISTTSDGIVILKPDELHATSWSRDV